MRIVFIIILRCIILFSVCQAGMAADYVKLTQLNTDDGLNQSHVSQILQDRDGYLWFGSLQGVNRYDGYRISTIHSPDDVLINNEIHFLYEDSRGLIWISEGSGVNYLLDKKNNRLTPIVLTAPDNYPLRYPAFTEAVEDPNGNLWLATFSEIYFYHRAQNRFEFIASLAAVIGQEKTEHSFRKLLLVGNHLLMATSSGLYVLDTESKQQRLILHTAKEIQHEHENNVKSLLLTSQGKIMVGTVGGLYQINPQSLQSNFGEYVGRTLVETLNIWDIIEKTDFFWLATDKGLYQYSKSGDLQFTFKYSDSPFNTVDDDIIKMIEDREGNLWFGSRADGVFKWRPAEGVSDHFWMKGDGNRRLSNDIVTAIHQTPNKDIWVGTENGLNKIDAKNQQVTQFLVNPDEKEVVSGSTIYNIADNLGKLWINTFDGIQVIDQQTMQLTLQPRPLDHPELFTKSAYELYFIDQQNLVVLNEDGVYRYNLQENRASVIESTITNGDIGKQFFKMFDTATGERDSYFISGVDRLAKYSPETGVVTDFHRLPESLNHRANPADLYRDGDTLWVTYPGYGIYLLNADTGEEKHFMSEKSLGINTAMDIFPDSQGNVWISSNEGLLRFNKDNLNLRVFDANDGFVTSEFNADTKLVLGNGDVYLGSIKGLFKIRPERMNNQNQRNVTPHISNISLLSSEIAPQYNHFDGYSLELAHDDFGVKVEFSALLFDKPKQVKYRYWFEGDSKTEATEINKSEIFFPAIKPGKNHLYISAIDYDSGLESAPVKIQIISHPAPWLSKTAYASYIFLILFITGSSFYRYRKRMNDKIKAHQKLQQSEERLSLALKGGNSGLWDWHADSNSVYEPRIQNTDQEEDEQTISFKRRIDAIHEDDQEKVIKIWTDFISQKTDVYDAVYRMQEKSGEWAWYRDMATITQFDLEEKPARVTGTYTNITERKLARDQVQLYSKAFENTRDIVFVLNNEKKVIAANQAFYKTTEFVTEKIMDKGISFITDFEGNKKLLTKIFKIIHQQNHWEGEGLLLRYIRRPLPILINATSFIDNEHNLDYVFALTDISKQKQAENELRKLANYDSLTGLPNRALLIDRITHAIEHSMRRKHKLAVFFVDLDRFKQINDTLGHDIGDLLLINVAHTIRRAIRHDDTVARLGGDEFVVLLEDIEGIEAISRIAQNILEQMKEPMVLRENKISTSPSIGIAIFPSDGTDAKQLLKHADVAMYHAKNAGRNNFQYFENSMNHAAQKRLTLENKLRHAVENHEIFYEYQPQYTIDSGALCGMEALARWKTAENELVSPAEFIPVAEDLGLIIPMTEYLIEQGLSYLSDWHQKGIDVGMAFNLSARHLHHYDFNQMIEELLAKYSIKTHLIEFELTESVLMQDVTTACRVFGKLAEKGVELALDDFGTGYSSLKYLSQLPINKLKIDRSFVSKIGRSHEDESIIHTIISLAKSLKLRTVAEGIETEEQLLFLREAGVDQAQGYYLSKPLGIDKIETLLTTKK